MTHAAKDSLALDGWAEETNVAEGSTDILDSLAPKLGDKDGNMVWEEVRQEPERLRYVPKVLQGTKYENEVEDLTKLLFGKGKGGFDTAVRLDQGNLTWALQTFKGLSPDEAARVQKIATERKIPFDQVERDSKSWKEWEESARIFESLFETNSKKELKYPYTANWLTNPTKMAQSKDDIAVLTQIEGLMTAYNSAWYKIAAKKIGEGTKALGRSAISIVQAAHELIGDASEAIDALTALPGDSPGPVKRLYALEQISREERRENVSDILASIKTSDFLAATPLPDIPGIKGFFFDAIEIVPQLVGTIGLGVVSGPVAGAAFIGGHIFGSTYGTLRDQGVDPERASIAAAGNAAIQSVLEFIGLNKLMQLFRTTGTKEIASAFIKATIAESGTEFLQSFPEEVAMIWGAAEKEGQSIDEQARLFVQRLPETMKRGLYEGLLVAPIAVLGGSVRLAHDLGKQRQIKKDIEFWDEYQTTAENSKLRKRSPNEFEKHSEAVIDNTDAPASVYVPLGAITTFYQDDQLAFQAFVETMEIAEQVAEARVTGQEIEMSSAKFTANFAGSDIAKALRKDLRFDLSGLTINEEAKIREEAQETLKDLEQEFLARAKDTAMPRQILAMRAQLILPKKEGGLGMKASDADAQLSVLLAGGKILSQKRGETLTEWFDRVNPTLRISQEEGPVPEAIPEAIPEVVAEFQETKEDKIARMRIQIAEGEAGRRVTIRTEEGEVITTVAEPSTLPEFFKGKDLKKKPVLNILDKFIAGKKLTEKQQGTLDVLFEDFIASSEELQAEEFRAQEILPQAARKGIRGSVQFSNAGAAIDLFKQANFSTLVHETGHIFTNEMKDLIDKGLADEQMTKDYNTLLEFAGGTLDLKAHEKVARAFEAYLREGKSPSIGLTRAFERFRAWLTAIYKNLTGLGVQINDEVRAVFDRLLASEREILEAQEYYKAKQSISELIPLTKKQKERVDKKKAVADNVALDRQTTKYLNAYLTAIGGKGKIVELAAQEINQEPVYQAIDDAIENGGLDLDSVNDTYGKEAVEKLAKNHRGLIEVKGAFNADSLAEKYGFNDGDVLLNDMLTAESKGKAIVTRTDETLAKREAEIRQELTRDEAIPGEEAIHNDAQLAYLIAEVQVLAEKISRQEADLARRRGEKVYRDVAEDVISAKKVSVATRYDLFAKSEQKWARMAFRALKEGDLQTALQAKKKQVLNHALVQAAVRARDEKIKIENRYKPAKIKQSLKNVENAYAEAAKDLIQTYQLTTNESVAPQKENAIFDLKELDEGLAAQTPDWILNKVLPEDFNTWRDLTMEQLTELDTAIQSIIHYGRDELKSIQDERFKTVEEAAQLSVETMANLRDKQIFNELSIKGRMLNTLDGLLSRITMNEFLFERFDNFEFTKKGTFGPMRTFFNRGVEAETDYTKIREDVYALVAPHWDVLSKAKTRLEKLYNGKDFDIPGVPMVEGMQKLGRHWTPERLTAFILNMGNASSLKVLDNSYGYTPDQRDIITSQFTEAELNAIQGIWDATESLAPGLDKTNFSVYNRHIKKVEAVAIEVKTSTGETITLEGGYYPLIFDHQLSDITASRQEEDILKNRNSAVYRSTKPQEGMTFARQEGHSLPPRLSLDVWFTHISDTARFISHAEYMRDLNKLTTNRAWIDAVRDKAGRPAYDQIREWVSDQAGPAHRVTNAWDNLLEYQRKMATIAILGANISVGVKQRLSTLSAIKEIGFKHYFQGLRQTDMKNSILGLSSSEAWQKVLKMSPFMKVRDGSFDREIRDAVSKMKPLSRKINLFGKDIGVKDVQDFMFTWIKMNDRATVGPVWYGAFNKSMEESAKSKLTEEQRTAQAVKAADAIVRTTQPSALPIDLNRLQASNGGVMKMFTSFMTWMFKMGNRLTFNYTAYREGAITSKEYFKHIMFEVLMAPWGAAIISSLWIKGELPEWWEYLTSPVENAIAWIPIVRDVPGAIKYRRPVGLPPAFEGFNRIVKTGKTGWEVLEGDKEFSQFAWDLGKALEVQVGVPALKFSSSVMRAYDNIKDAVEE